MSMHDLGELRILCVVSDEITDMELKRINDKLKCNNAIAIITNDFSMHNLISLLNSSADLDAFICFGGNEDISPILYGDSIEYSKHINNNRDYFEIELFNYAFNNNIPFLGICRGMQIINIALGGTLNQDLTNKLVHYCDWEMYCKTNIHSLHKVDIVPNTKLSHAFLEKSISVNSYHHQCIDKVGHGLIINALCDDGVIEGIEHVEKPIVGIQWHVELMDDLNSELFFSWFLNTVYTRKGRK